MEKNLDSTAVEFAANLRILSANSLDLHRPWSGEGCVNSTRLSSRRAAPTQGAYVYTGCENVSNYFPKLMKRSLHHLVWTIYLLNKSFLRKRVPLILIKTREILKFAQPLGSFLRSL